MSSPSSNKKVLSYIEAHWKFLAIITFILLFSTILRTYNLGEPVGYYFDEVYHAMTVKLIARGDPRAFEWIHGDSIEPGTYVEWLHPPLAKYFQAIGVLLVGETGLGWRLSNAFFGLAVITLIGVLSWQATKDLRVSTLAMGLGSLETLLLVESRIATNDIFVTFFILLTMCAYFWYLRSPTYQRLLLVGAFSGLALSAKWSGVFILCWVITVELLLLIGAHAKSLQNIQIKVVPLLFGIFSRLIALITLPIFIYIASYWMMFSQGKDFAHFLELHSQIIIYQTTLDASHPYESRPWQWFINSKPVWYLVEYGSGDQRKDIYAVGNPIIFWMGAVAVTSTTIWLVVYVFQHHRKIRIRLQSFRISTKYLHHPIPHISPWLGIGLITLAYWWVWIPWFFSPRIMFFYHYLPAVPLMICVTSAVIVRTYDVSLILQKTQKNLSLIIQASIIGLGALSVVSFVWLLPHALALIIPHWWKESLFLFGLWQ